MKNSLLAPLSVCGSAGGAGGGQRPSRQLASSVFSSRPAGTAAAAKAKAEADGSRVEAGVAGAFVVVFRCLVVE